MMSFLLSNSVWRRRSALLAAALLSGLLFSGCTSPYNPGGAGDIVDAVEDALGVLRISSVLPEGDGIAGSSVFPDVAADAVVSYEIEITNREDASLAYTQEAAAGASGDIATPVVFEDVVPGEYDLVVRGFDGPVGDAGVTQLVEGSDVVTVGAASEVDLSVTVTLISDAGVNGSWSFTLQWPIDSGEAFPITDVVTTAEYSVDGGSSWTETTVTESGGNRSITVGGSRAPGDFQLQVRLNTDKPAPYDTVYTYVEQWHVFGNVSTTKELILTSDEFSYGGNSGITVSVDLLSDPDNFFDGTPASTVTGGNSFIINVDETDSLVGAPGAGYAWRVDGETQPGETGTSFTLSTTPDEAGMVKVITLEVTVDGVVYSGSHRVRVVAP